MRVTLLQYAPVWEDRLATREKIAALLSGAGASDWLVLPEMALSGFSMDKRATTWDAGDFAFFSSLSRERGCWISVGGVEAGRNTAFAFDAKGELAVRYPKRHLFAYGEEDRHYEAGEGNASYRIGELSVAQAICYDLRFPYHFWPDAPRVECYCVIAAWGAKRALHWKTLLRARAIENQAFAVGVNRIGDEPKVSYAGDSAVIGPRGETLLDCGQAEGAFSVDIDAGEVARWRAEFPAFRDRRA